MTHNMEADFAASELAWMFSATPAECFNGTRIPLDPSASASYEPSTSPWPKADGMVSVFEPSTNESKSIALEYKRPNEGIHGLLTAMGQAYAYLHKGYHGVAIVVPREYPTHGQPGAFLRSALDYIDGSTAIGVFDYESPDVSRAAPFRGRLRCVRPFSLETPRNVAPISTTPRTQWVHMREGSTTRDGFFRFIETARVKSAGASRPIVLPEPLIAASRRLAADREPTAYIANVADDRFLSKVWEQFWFDWIATPEVLVPWVIRDGLYYPPAASTKIRRDDDRGYSQIFEGRANGLKESICALLNEGTVTEDRAWELLIEGISSDKGPSKQGIRSRAHSFREDIDSSLAQLDWIDDSGRPTEYGQRFASLCERFGGANSSAARDYFGSTLIQTGRYGSFLHYINKLSEAQFKLDPLAFTKELSTGRPAFTEDSYWEYLEYMETQMADELKVLRKVSGRSRPRRRTEFQAELTLLRNYGFIAKSRYRLGVGIPIDWDRVMQAQNAEL